ncbi:type II toxin-antitoxin system RelE/ParE family toxin [Candidatus Babeliales bacterium]|nr:type II toxin-antitoxin system RelE/ParE family toxin [Candidatus Babeliales bacterium]
MSGNKPYKVEYLTSVIDEDISKLNKKIKLMIKRAIEKQLMLDPIGFGKPLRYSLKGHRRLRVSNYRVVYRINANSNVILIVAIKHRKEIYEKL